MRKGVFLPLFSIEVLQIVFKQSEGIIVEFHEVRNTGMTRMRSVVVRCAAGIVAPHKNIGQPQLRPFNYLK